MEPGGSGKVVQKHDHEKCARGRQQLIMANTVVDSFTDMSLLHATSTAASNNLFLMLICHSIGCHFKMTAVNL